MRRGWPCRRPAIVGKGSPASDGNQSESTGMLVAGGVTPGAAPRSPPSCSSGVPESCAPPVAGPLPSLPTDDPPCGASPRPGSPAAVLLIGGGQVPPSPPAAAVTGRPTDPPRRCRAQRALGLVMNAAPPMSVESNHLGWMPMYSATSLSDICRPPSDGNAAAVANPSTSPSSRPASASAPRMRSGRGSRTDGRPGHAVAATRRRRRPPPLRLGTPLAAPRLQ